MPAGIKKPGADAVLRARAEGRTYTAQELVERANQLEGKLAQLRNRYEQHFLGLERKPPSTDRDGLHKELDTLRQISTPNTAVKFRLNTLFNRMLTYERMWMRTERDIEEGRYRRDIFKARLHAQQQREEEKTDPGDGPPGKATGPTAQAGAQPAAQKGQPRPAAPRAGTPAGPDDQRLRTIFDTFVQAKKECREPTEGLTYEQLSTRIKAQLPTLLQHSGGKAIDFKVVVKDGKATLRAVTKD